jgi:hypothetical protein
VNSIARITRAPKIPPLRDGDALTVREFERRHEAMPSVKKAELIEGVVRIGSPVSIKSHGSPHGSMTAWLGHYHAFTPGTELGDNSTLKLAIGDSQPQPDDLLRILPERGGISRTDKDGYVVGGVELAAEISASSVAIDVHEKFVAYEKNGILEYVVWRVEDREIDWFVLKQGKCQRLPKSRLGVYKSKVFPGLWLDTPSLIAGNLARVIEVVQQGVASPEHQRFIKRLQAREKA